MNIDLNRYNLDGMCYSELVTLYDETALFLARVSRAIHQITESADYMPSPVSTVDENSP